MHSLTTERLGQRFGRRILFRKMNIAFHSGHSTAIVGSNGSGKSTLVRILAGLMRPTKGEVILNVDGNEVEGEWRPLSCGLVAPYLNVYEDFTPRENLDFIAKARRLPHRETRIEQVLDEVQMLHRADDVVNTFSSGMLQRIRIASALLADPPVLLLDDVMTTGATLDAAARTLEAMGARVHLVVAALRRESFNPRSRLSDSPRHQS